MVLTTTPFSGLQAGLPDDGRLLHSQDVLPAGHSRGDGMELTETQDSRTEGELTHHPHQENTPPGPLLGGGKVLM